jgi:hypothetical protein
LGRAGSDEFRGRGVEAGEFEALGELAPFVWAGSGLDRALLIGLPDPDGNHREACSPNYSRPQLYDAAAALSTYVTSRARR